MKITAEKKLEYEGSMDGAPRWARWLVTKWYRRILVAPITTYVVVVVGISLSGKFEGIENFLCLPSYMLLFVIASDAQKLWYRKRFEEQETPPTN